MDFSSAVVAVAAGIFACEQVRQAVSVTTACREGEAHIPTHADQCQCNDNDFGKHAANVSLKSDYRCCNHGYLTGNME